MESKLLPYTVDFECQACGTITKLKLDRPVPKPTRTPEVALAISMLQHTSFSTDEQCQAWLAVAAYISSKVKPTERIELPGVEMYELGSGYFVTWLKFENRWQWVLHQPAANPRPLGKRIYSDEMKAFAAAMVRDTPKQSDEAVARDIIQGNYPKDITPAPQHVKEVAEKIARHRGRDTTALHGLLKRAECEMRYAGWNAEQPDHVARKPLYDDVVAALTATPQGAAPEKQFMFSTWDQHGRHKHYSDGSVEHCSTPKENT